MEGGRGPLGRVYGDRVLSDFAAAYRGSHFSGRRSLRLSTPTAPLLSPLQAACV